MADKYYWIGSAGPFIYDDTALYPDGKPHAAIHGEIGHTSEVPVDDSDIANKKYVDDETKKIKVEAYKVNDLCFNLDGVNPFVKYGYGVWSLLGTTSWTLS